MPVRIFYFIFLIVSVLRAADAPAEDPAVALARILADKGAISTADLAAVTAAADRVGVLAGILRDKGLLSDAEVARFRPSPAAPAPAPVVNAAVPKSAPAPAPASANRPTLSGYGTILFNAFYNDASTNIQDVPLFANKQGSDATGGDKNFGMTARQTRLGLRFQQPNVAGAKLTGQFEFDLFAGKTPLTNGMDMDIFRLRLAYGRLDWKHASFEAGQDWALFAPLNPISLAEFSIPEFSASGNPWIRLPQVRAEFSGGNFLWQIAALDPNMGDYQTTAFSTARQPGIGERGRMPSIESRVAWTRGAASVGVSGHYGRGKNLGVPVDSWGIALDYTAPLNRYFTLAGEAYEGRALGIFSVTAGESVGAPGTPGAHGVESRGGWSQLQFHPAQQWQLNVGYGLEVPNASQLPIGNRWRNQTYSGNVIFKLTPGVNFALEYRRMLTDYRNQLAAYERGDHVNLGVAYIF